jgi:hypothetical protein|tara:strand:+ start:10133 stop:10561 length:429 start_codon:yes stop_codon:yes gene_type:complete
MKLIFLDIDGVLNNCMSSGVFHESSTIHECISELNRILLTSEAGIILISTWKDSYDFKTIKNLLYERGVYQHSILGLTPIGINKEEGITYFLNNPPLEIDEFVIIDDNLDMKDELLRSKYIKTESMIGLTNTDADLAIQKLQ